MAAERDEREPKAEAELEIGELREKLRVLQADLQERCRQAELLRRNYEDARREGGRMRAVIGGYVGVVMVTSMIKRWRGQRSRSQT